jgi:hypothetical protein
MVLIELAGSRSLNLRCGLQGSDTNKFLKLSTSYSQLEPFCFQVVMASFSKIPTYFSKINVDISPLVSYSYMQCWASTGKKSSVCLKETPLTVANRKVKSSTAPTNTTRHTHNRHPRVKCSQCKRRPEVLQVDSCDKCDTKNICPNCYCNCLSPMQRAVADNKLIRLRIPEWRTKVRLLEVISKDRQYTPDEREDLDLLNLCIERAECRLNQFAVLVGLAD